MTDFHEHSTLMMAHTEIDVVIAELEKKCFDIKAPMDVTQAARIRRAQLIEVKELLLLKRHKLTP